MALVHSFTSPKSDSADATKIQPSHWNSGHLLSEAGVAYSAAASGSIACVSATGYLQFLRRKFNAASEQAFEFANFHYVQSGDFNFTAISPSTNLTGGISNTITLTSVPLGINGSNTNHYLRIVDGIAGNEVVLITGGTATSGGASQTITFTPSLSHTTGNYTLISASAGIQEAVKYLGTSGGKISIPSGNQDIYAPVYVDKHVRIYGAGKECTILRNRNATANCLKFSLASAGGVGSAAGVHDLTIIGGSDSTSTTANFTTGAAIYVDSSNNDMTISRVGIRNHAYGIYINDCFNSPRVYDCSLLYIGTYAIIHDSSTNSHGGCTIESTQISNNGATGTVASSGAGIFYKAGAAFYVLEVDIMAMPVGVLVEPTVGNRAIHGFWTNVKCDTSIYDGWQIKGGSGTVYCHVMTGCWGAGSGKDTPAAAFTRYSNGVLITGANTSGIFWNGGRARGNGARGFSLESGCSNISITNVLIVSNSQVPTSTEPGIYVAAGVSKFAIENNRIGNFDAVFTSTGQYNGILIAVGSSNDYVITGNNLLTNTSQAIKDGGTGQNKIVKNNLRPESEVTITVASASTLSLGDGHPENVFVTGTTQLVNMSPSYYNQEVTLIFNNAAPAGVTTGGTAGIAFATALITAQNIRMQCKYVQNSWFPK